MWMLLLIDCVVLLIFFTYLRVLMVHLIKSPSNFSSITVMENSSANQSMPDMYRTASLKHRDYRLVIVLCAVYAGAVLVQGGTKLVLNVYRSWVGERATRDLRRRVRVLVSSPSPASSGLEAQGIQASMIVGKLNRSADSSERAFLSPCCREACCFPC